MRTAVAFAIACTVVTAVLLRADAPPPSAPPPASRVLMDEMTTTEVRDAIAAGKTTLLIYNASTEQSGPHMALGKHIFHARYLGERIARELGNALVAPIMPFAPLDDELMKFPGSIRISPETQARVMEEVVASFAGQGFKYLILMSNHGGAQPALKELAPKLDARYRAQGMRVFFSAAPYSGSSEIGEYMKSHNLPASGHGGIDDTSELWDAGAQYIRPDKIAMGDPITRGPGGALKLGPTGVAGDPRPSSAALGKIFNDIRVRNGVSAIRRLISES